MIRLWHDTTDRQLDAFAASLPHAMLITGQKGAGVRAASEELARRSGAQLEWVLPEKKEVVDRDGGIISVQIIRRLYEQTKSRTSEERLIVIDRADTMSHQAQNAFLKLLEEPIRRIHFVLLAHDTSVLLPTIRSRVQPLEVKPLSRQQSEVYLDELRVTDPTIRSQLLFLAEGLPEELEMLARDQDYLAARAVIIRDARQFFQGSVYEQLAVIQRYKDDRTAALQLLAAAMKVATLALQKQPDQHIVHRLERYLSASDAISRNGNTRLQLTAAVV